MDLHAQHIGALAPINDMNMRVAHRHRGVRLQVFVANPNKTQPIIDILAGNKDKLLRYLADFHSDKSASPHFLSSTGQHSHVVT